MSDTKTSAPIINEPFVPIFVMGERFDVPASLTIQKALEYAGYQLVRGVGCRGGICGACGTVYRIPGDHAIKVGLACQTVVERGMHIAVLPFFPAKRRVYNIRDARPEPQIFMDYYPEIMRCMGCNTCTKSCPMDINVMEYVSAAIRGDIEKAATLSFDCVMCGLCTARCPGELSQYNIGILARRLYGRYVAHDAAHVREMVERVAQGRYVEDLHQLMAVSMEDLKKIYMQREVEPEMSLDDWAPKSPDHL
ncbi:MAG: 4Fe-4S dicluster domain-containing protein [Acidobacteria bacterium]|nr:4Fe-4S dicluster domain-containing protein [Acidobacteriota bacterium]